MKLLKLTDEVPMVVFELEDVRDWQVKQPEAPLEHGPVAKKPRVERPA